MKSKISNINYLFLGLLVSICIVYTACEKDITYDKTRLFRPVLGSQLEVKENKIMVNLGKIKDAVSYTVEVSRDSFKVVDYTFMTDTNAFVIDENLIGEELLYNTLYQIRATAHATSPEYDSKAADLGSVRTERFPSILNLPLAYYVTDTKAKVTWRVAGAAVTKIKTFSATDLRLKTPLTEYDVPESAQVAGEYIIDKLAPDTKYQVAIYSGNTLRGWVDYKTLVAGVDPSAGNVIDLSDITDPNAVIDAVATAADGSLILLQKGIQYELPDGSLDRSITIKAAYGFTPTKASLHTTGNWNVAKGAQIDHIVFDDLEIFGEDIGGDYVFNINNSGATTINELKFENCILHDFRGIIRTRADVFVKNYIISNSIVHHIGGYGIFTCDTDGDNKASIDNVKFENSTFYKVNTFLTTRQNCQSVLINSCTLNEVASTGQNVFRFRGAAGKNDALNGLTISNSIWGHGWDEASSGNYNVTFKAGLPNTTVSIVNTWSTADFAATAGTELSGFPALNYSNKTENLWVNPDAGNFQFKDGGFAGKFDSGDPRWRVKL